MNRNINLTEGNIVSTLTKLALPIMGTSFIQMAYNLTDIMWLGRLSTNAVAAAAIVGFFIWFGAALVMISQVGVGVGVAQSYGREDMIGAREYISTGFQLNITIAVFYSLFLFLFRNYIIGFFHIDDPQVVSMAIEYLTIISIGMIFHFLNPIFSATLNSSGNSITPFKVSTIGLVANMILDPILIFGLGPIPGFGIKGAAIATISSQFVVTIMFVSLGKRKHTLYSHVELFSKPNFDYLKKILIIGFPPSVQMGIHASISMMLARIVSSFGPVAIAVQGIGSQIESLSWMTAEGFSTAISAFVGQNYGAKKFDRIKDGYKKAMGLVGGIGLFASLLLIFAAKPLFTIFTPEDPIAIKEGIIYLRVLGLSQFFMSIEIGTSGAFNGLGKTLPPTIVGITLNALRIPIAIALSGYTVLGLAGVWWSITLTSIVKGIILVIWFNHLLNNKLDKENIDSIERVIPL
jgi:putative MATE family efflux protein